MTSNAVASGSFRTLYSVGEELGRGSFAVVHKCLHQETKQPFAVKVVDKSKATPAQLQDIEQEIAVMRALRHPHIINMEDFMSSPSTMYIVLELVRGGDLFKAITRFTSYSEAIAASLIKNSIAAIQYIHEQGVAHRDLKPDNMLLIHPITKTKLDPTSDFHLSAVKIADFGFATKTASEPDMTKCCGTPYYIAPEILNCGLYKTMGPYGRQCDMWSMGIITYVLLCGFPPFQAQKRNALFKLIVRGKFKFPTGTVWDSLSASAKDFVTKLIQINPQVRLTPAQALEHPWLKEAHQEVDGCSQHRPKVQRRISEFNARHKLKGAVYGVEAAFRLVYIQKCQEKGIRVNSKITGDMEAQAKDESDTVDLSNNYVGKKGLEPVMDMVAAKTKMKKLVLRHNEIENTSVNMIVRTLAKHPSITHLDLAKNPLSRAGAKKLIHLIQVNPNITKLELEGTQIRDEKREQIESLLERNRGRSAAMAAAAVASTPKKGASGSAAASANSSAAAKYMV